jgi:hypothetical protein
MKASRRSNSPRKSNIIVEDDDDTEDKDEKLEVSLGENNYEIIINGEVYIKKPGRKQYKKNGERLALDPDKDTPPPVGY